MRKIIALVPAAGIGSRMQADKPKQYLKINGKTILEYTVDKLLKHNNINTVIVAIAENDPYIKTLDLFSNPNVTFVTGGNTRAKSVLNGLYYINKHFDDAWALVHDAARPCITHQDIDKLLAIKEKCGAILAKPAIDTIKRATRHNTIQNTENRSELWLAQTPQFFPADILKNTLENAIKNGDEITDEASAMELAGFQPHLVIGRNDNIKVTNPEDLALVSFYLNN
ncbi:2-C-methyl-D-erythritol 4-phosphate cytidylyltransferase [Bisgaardia hudsonensis]|uniref:2-C-methyl-D-erythritol 4-phosphate cytidylyltransferase n=1 Tax=Bisgaardia hudsonensis TaxID=109472 RepID=A0A4V2SJ99_9PAST|nr:2-C-methyl-D-erythritol 4-phosphate cytidylyltransferase [Bisgaardia hudsonensis]TCP13930.1 2-C-methyl-D-erythritol 4-phosphate cytidylyltransferase [Bisgaardia hudsonensis]